MSTTPPQAPGPGEQAPVPAGYQPGDYVPFRDRDPTNPSAVAGQWADPARQAQLGGGRPMTAQERYRAIYGADAPDRVEYASWLRRVLGALVDGVLGAIVSVPFIVGYVGLLTSIHATSDTTGSQAVRTTTDVSATTVALLVIGGLISIAFLFYNQIYRQGRTGYTFGKTVVGIRLVRESTGQPPGALQAFVRQLAHYVDSLICYLGWLWPLWDAKRQTLGDKIMGTVVVVQDPDELLH